MLKETLGQIEAMDAFFANLTWPSYQDDPKAAAQTVQQLIDYLSLNLDEFLTDTKKALKESDRHESAYAYCKNDYDDLVDDMKELFECLVDFEKYKENPNKAANYYKLVVGQMNSVYQSYSEFWDAVYEKNQIDRVDNVIKNVVKSYRSGMDTMRSSGRLLMQRQTRDKSKRYPRQEGTNKYGFFQLPAKTDPTMQHHQLLEEIKDAVHPAEKMAVIEKYILDPAAKGSFYQQSFKTKMVVALNELVFRKDIDGLARITPKMTPAKIQTVFSENAAQWRQYHFPNYQLPHALVSGPSVK